MKKIHIICMIPIASLQNIMALMIVNLNIAVNTKFLGTNKPGRTTPGTKNPTSVGAEAETA